MINYKKIFSILPEILALPLIRRGKRWCLPTYIDLRASNRKDKLVFYLNKGESITVTEQGGDSMSLFRWLELYSDCKDAKDVYDKLDGDNKIRVDISKYINEGSDEEEVKYVSEKNVSRLMRDEGRVGCSRTDNNLYNYLCTVFPQSSVDKAFDSYRVGTIGNTCIFWKTKRDGRVCNDNRIMYCENGRRDKERNAYRVFKTGEGFTSKGYFGWHLVSLSGSRDVCVVESEKSALIASIVFPDKTWIACAGMNQLHYIGKKWKLYPDYAVEAIGLWKVKGSIVEWWDDECQRNDDMADMVLRMVIATGE